MAAGAQELEQAVQRLSLERAASERMNSPVGHGRSGRRSLRSEPFFIGVAGGTASGEHVRAGVQQWCRCSRRVC